MFTTKFADFDQSTDYDKLIEASRKRITERADPCFTVMELPKLVNQLKTLQNAYTPRPCPSGFCFGLATPHRSRIRSRISAIEQETLRHHPKCGEELQRFRTAAAKQARKRELEQERQNEARHHIETTEPPHKPLA